MKQPEFCEPERVSYIGHRHDHCLAGPQKVKHKVITGTSSPKYIFRKIKNISPKNLYATVYTSIIQNSQKIEITQCPSTDKCINKM